ncbi:M48 family metalloprotease [Rhodobacteraceae bacterium]|nr:M48 family metalloprotease [Paracoccaceae bacterium]
MLIRRISLTVAGLISGVASAFAEPQVVCTVTECQDVEIAIPEFAGAQNLTVNQVWALAGEILAVSGLAPNFQVIESDEVANAAAIVRRSERYLVFNPEWLERVAANATSKWEVYGVLAHEIGHHLQGHTLLGIGSRPPVELEADTYAGFALGALGASKEQALALWRGFGEEGSSTHPPRHQRLAAVERGWLRAAQRPGGIAVADDTSSAEEETPRPLPTPKRSDARDRSRDASCVPVSTAVGQAVVCATSVLSDGTGAAHSPAFLFDQDPETVWKEDGVRFGAGQSIAVEFANPTDIRRVLFHGGLDGAAPRIKQLVVKSSSGFVGTIYLEDDLDWQFVSLPLGSADWISLTIEDVYPGTGRQDTPIGEISFE